MKRFALLGLCATLSATAFSQDGQPKQEMPKTYRAAAEKINDLVHTKMEAKFDYAKSQMNGKAWVSLRPHFYPTDSLSLDAKGMEIRQVAIVKNGKNTPLKYNYDGLVLDIQLDKSYKNSEQYTVYIDYTAKPNDFQAKGSAAITDAKGLYFINPMGEDKNKPIQVWTQGETEATSVWIPTIDRPNQKTTEEFYLTVPQKYVTLSNGKLVSSKKNTDGTRTDYWKMDQPHAPYLFFMGIGDYAVIKDQYKGKEVSYYVEKEYAPVARKIFGETPQMIALFSKLTGVDYPWVKYAQITGRDYVSGAMENTTATLHSDFAQQDARELTDGNRWEEVIAHELFHQWFGDYVTTESWSNLTLNESFATLGSQLWNEYRYGKDAGQEERYNSVRGYLNSRSDKKDLVRFYYNDKEDMFDAVSYNKGGGILQMLRNFVGDSAFFKSLNLYLTSNKYKSAEAHQLRLAFEEVTGKDLNWFFNQWYFNSGNPKFNITYGYNDATHQASMIVEQTGDKVFQIPVKVDVWSGATPATTTIWTKNKIDTFYFPAASRPKLINFDADKILVADKTENKTLEEYLYQYRVAKNYADRREAIDAAISKQAEVNAAEILKLAMKDPYGPLRAYAINALNMSTGQTKSAAEQLLADIAQKDNFRPAKAAAIAKLGEYKSNNYAPIFRNAINDSSYTVSGNALEALGKIDSAGASNEAKRLMAAPSKGKLAAVSKKLASPVNGDKLVADFNAMPLGQPKFAALQDLFDFMESTSNTEQFKKGVDAVLTLMTQIPDAYKEQVNPQLTTALKELQTQKTNSGLKEQADYIGSKLSKEKGF